MRLHLFLIIIGTLLAVACNDDEPQEEITPVYTEKTVIVYMAAENNLNRFASPDIEEMTTGAAQLPEGQQLAVFIDDVQTPRIYRIDRNGKSLLRQYGEDFCSTDSTRMEQVLKDIFAACPADSYGLVLWSHGTGWTPATVRSRTVPRSFGVDNEQNSAASASGREMEITTLAHILEHHPHMEFILFDACLMQGIEVAYELKDVTDYVIGSPAETPGTGAPYHKVVPFMFRTPADAKGIVDSYFSYYEGSYGMLISAIRTDRLEPVADFTLHYLTPLCTGQVVLDTEGVQAYYAFHRSTGYKPEFFDMNGLMKLHMSEQVFAEWQAILDEAVPYRRATSTWLTSFSAVTPYIRDLSLFGGITMFVPNEKYTSPDLNAALHAFRWYKAAGWDATGW